MECKILDCTLRDGGYYTDWDFDDIVVESYINSMSKLPIDFIEIGYRSIKLNGYLGKYFYLPISTIRYIKSKTDKKLVIILNEKDIRVEHLDSVLEQCKGLIDLVRIAIDPKNINRAITLAKGIKKMGFDVGLNVMYMSTWFEQKEFLKSLPKINKVADYFYMVDSFGAIYPKDLIEIYNLIKKDLTISIGFHGHNNLELAFINTLTAIDCGVDIVDSTITGMGRGAGNLKTELLLTSLNSKGIKEVDFNSLSNVIEIFSKLQKKHEWGTNLPYMVSGAKSLPQKQVMEWVSKKFYSMNSITRALSDNTIKQNENSEYENFNTILSFESVVIVGGGVSINKHRKPLLKYLDHRKNSLAIVHASSRNANVFKNLKNHQYLCLVGNEGIRLEHIFEDLTQFQGKCILPPSPRIMGTYVPKLVRKNTYQLETINFTDLKTDMNTAIAIQTSLLLGAKTIYLIGYDGYSGNSISEQFQELFVENSKLFKDIPKDVDCISLTPTKYKDVKQSSIYKMIE